MIIVSMLSAAVAAFLAVGAPPGRRLRQRLAPVDDGLPSFVRRRRLGWTGPAVGLLIAAVAGVLGGPKGLWLSVPIMITAGTAIMIIRRNRRRGRAMARRREVAQACSVLAAQVRIGQVPVSALRSAAEDCPVLRPAVATAALGGDVAARWHEQSRLPGQAGLADLARAWQLATVTGASMADALEDVAEALEQDESLALVINSEAAGPRASGKVMAGLPVIGVGLGYLIGGDPVGFLTGTPYGWGCLIGGAVLAAAGVLWMERVADHAAVGERS